MQSSKITISENEARVRPSAADIGIDDLLSSPDWGDDLDCGHLFENNRCDAVLPDRGWAKKTKILKQKFLFAEREQDASVWLRGKLPAPGEDLITISTGMWDYWHLPLCILNNIRQGDVREIYASTWAFNRETLISFQEQIEYHKCKTVFMVTSFNSGRYPAEHYLLVQTLEKHGGTLISLNQHGKIFLIAAPPNYYSLTGSANMTKNENIEQTTITNDKERFLFYRSFFQHFMKKHERSDYQD